MRFSLVVASKNRVKELERFLHSLTEQIHADFEVILVDQNADERLVALVQRYSQPLSILHIRQPDPGLSRARNRGLEHITGNVVCFPDDDCVYQPDTLARVADFFETRSGWDGLIAHVLDLDEDTPAMLFQAMAPGNVDYDRGWWLGMTAAMFFRRQFADAVRFDETFGPGTPWPATEDIDYLYSCLDQGAKVCYEPEIVLRHPTPWKVYTVWQLIRREYSHGRGAGYLMGKRRFPLSKVAMEVLRPLINLFPYLAQGKPQVAAFMPGITLGRLQGYIGHLRARYLEHKNP